MNRQQKSKFIIHQTKFLIQSNSIIENFLLIKGLRVWSHCTLFSQMTLSFWWNFVRRLKGRSKDGRRAMDRHSSDQPPTESDWKRPLHPTEKVVQRDDLVRCLSKKFSIIPSDRIEKSARWHNLLFFTYFFHFFSWNLPALSPLTYSSRSARPPILL